MRLLHLLLFNCLAAAATAQQEAIFSQFFYNKTHSNPGAAGSGGQPFLAAFHRQQWAGLEGAPSTQALSFNSPAFAGRVGLGLSLVRDRIGFFNSTFINAAYAYRIPFGEGRLGVGVQGSFLHFATDWERVRTLGAGADPTAGADDAVPVFNIGVGAHFEGERFFAGVSVPYFLEKGLTQNNAGIVADFSGTAPHLFVTAGGVANVSAQVKMRPAFALRVVKNAPPSADAHLSFGFLEEAKLWVGGTYRWSASTAPALGDAAVLTAQWQMSERLRGGAAYEFSINGLQRENGGTYELMLEWCLAGQRRGVRNPRYF